MFLLLPTVGYCFNPSIQLTNTTRGGSTVFYVGDNWTLSIGGGLPNAAVIGIANGNFTPYGSTDGNGNWSLSGYMSQGDVGQWSESWTVGGETASPDPLLFTVYPASAVGCSLYAGATPPVLVSIDWYDYYTGWLLAQYPASGGTQATLNPAEYCLMHNVTWYRGPTISAAHTQWGPYSDVWSLWDSGYRASYNYPMIDSAGYSWLAVNVTNGNLYVASVVIPHYIYAQFL